MIFKYKFKVNNFIFIRIVLPPIETVGLTVDNVDDLTESTRKLMIDTLSTLSTKPLGNSEASSCVNPVDKKNE